MHADILIDADNQPGRMLTSILWVMGRMEVKISGVHLFGKGLGNSMDKWGEAWRKQAARVKVFKHMDAGSDFMGIKTLMTETAPSSEAGAEENGVKLCLLITDNSELVEAAERSRSASDHRLVLHISAQMLPGSTGTRTSHHRPGTNPPGQGSWLNS